MSLYDCGHGGSRADGEGGAPLVEIPFESERGPAFIWSLNFSTDDVYLAVECIAVCK